MNSDAFAVEVYSEEFAVVDSEGGLPVVLSVGGLLDPGK